jgi:hypothetical protein
MNWVHLFKSFFSSIFIFPYYKWFQILLENRYLQP